MKIRDLGEIGLIKRIAARTRRDRSVVSGIGDDTAVIKWTGDRYLLAACDMLVEGTHFAPGKASPFRIGWKAMARNLSDIAAMGGLPRHALISVGIDPRLPVSFADGLYSGLSAAAGMFKVNIVGGDTARSDRLVIDVSVIGEVEKNRLVLRSGARKGDIIMVTGSIGGSIRGKHLDFIPRVKEARMITGGYKVNSMIDISDGLTLDLCRILDAGSVGARIYEKLIPVSEDAASFEKAITDGEDFELLFTLGLTEASRLLSGAGPKLGVPVTPIGEITDKGLGCKVIYGDGKARPVGKKGYLHF